MRETLKPLGNNMLVKMDAPPVKTESGLVLPADRKDKLTDLQRGVVMAVGPGAVVPGVGRIPAQVSVGDRVILPNYRGVGELVMEAEKYLLVSMDIALAVVIEPVA